MSRHLRPVPDVATAERLPPRPPDVTFPARQALAAVLRPLVAPDDLEHIASVTIRRDELWIYSERALPGLGPAMSHSGRGIHTYRVAGDLT